MNPFSKVHIEIIKKLIMNTISSELWNEYYFLALLPKEKKLFAFRFDFPHNSIADYNRDDVLYRMPIRADD